MLLLLACFTLGCQSTPAEAGAKPAASAEEAPALLDVRVAVDDARATLQYAQASVTHEAIAAADLLSVTCPYARSSWQLAVALHVEVSRIDASKLPPHLRRDWRDLQRGLDTHVAILDELGVELAWPAPGDYLDAHLPMDARQTRAMLEKSSTPVADSEPLFLAIDPIVDGYDDAIRRVLEDSYPPVSDAIGGDATMKPLLSAWQRALERLLPEIEDAQVHAQVNSMISALKGLSGRGC